MKSVEKILVPYSGRLAKETYKKRIAGDYTSPDLYLFMKWAYRVEEGWYGFALSDDVPMVWAQIIDDFLSELQVAAPNFKIQQIKLKFGGLRFYVDLKIEDEVKAQEIGSEIVKLCTVLFHKDLIY